MFSIVIPVYNKAGQLERTLNTVFQQTFSAFEVIIVDDGSTDGSIQVIESRFSDSRIRIISQQNAGVSAARNKGIEQARYDYIAFLDADDLWHPRYLETMHEAIRKFPEAGIFGADYQWIFPDETVSIQEIKEPAAPVVQQDYFEHALTRLIFWTSATVVRKSVLDATGLFNPGLLVGEDLDLWFRILLRFEGIHVPVQLSWYMRSDRAQVGPGKLVPFERNLSGRALELYRDVLSSGNPAFERFIYNFVLSDLFFYYFDPQYKHVAIGLLKSIPLKYKWRRLRFVLYFMPYNWANTLYQRFRRTKG